MAKRKQKIVRERQAEVAKDAWGGARGGRV
jgi:hypothetical protein